LVNDVARDNARRSDLFGKVILPPGIGQFVVPPVEVAFMDIGIEQTYEILACPDTDPVDRIAAQDELIAHHQAQQMLHARAVAIAQPAEE
jgi:hypothetical protein